MNKDYYNYIVGILGIIGFFTVITLAYNYITKPVVNSESDCKLNEIMVIDYEYFTADDTFGRTYEGEEEIKCCVRKNSYRAMQEYCERAAEESDYENLRIHFGLDEVNAQKFCDKIDFYDKEPCKI